MKRGCLQLTPDIVLMTRSKTLPFYSFIGSAGTIYGQVSASVKAKKILIITIIITHIYVSSVFSVEAPIVDTLQKMN